MHRPNDLCRRLGSLHRICLDMWTKSACDDMMYHQGREGRIKMVCFPPWQTGWEEKQSNEEEALQLHTWSYQYADGKWCWHRCIIVGDGKLEDIMQITSMKAKTCQVVNEEDTDKLPSGSRYKCELLLVWWRCTWWVIWDYCWGLAWLMTGLTWFTDTRKVDVWRLTNKAR